MSTAPRKTKTPEVISNQVTIAPSAYPEGEENVPTLEERKTQELVFAMVAPIGSGASTVAGVLMNKLREDYGYDVNYIKVSDLINKRSQDEGGQVVDETDPSRVEKLQNLGNELRERHGKGALSIFSINEINSTRSDDQNGDDRRYCTVIDSLKHPEEVSILRQVYGDLFWLVGVFAPEDKRISRLEEAMPSSSYLAKIKDKDYDEGLESGQSVRKTMNFSDIFIRNDSDNLDKINRTVDRYLKLIFGIGVQTPSKDEYAMQAASGVALNSACLSRQVGAVIVSEKGEIIGKGANDVPKYGGGTYNVDDGSEDHRCYKWKSCECWNDHHKNRLFRQISTKLKDHIEPSRVEEAIKSTDAKNLIEFSRAVHAEMEAIISVARQGNAGIVGSRLFTTTFPCHNCARHIVVSGINGVVYIEPYPKSLALTLHADAITTNPDEAGKVTFLQYEGVSPSSFSRVFGEKFARKDSGKAIDVKPKTARPLASPPLDSLVTREQLVLDPVLKKEGI